MFRQLKASNKGGARHAPLRADSFFFTRQKRNYCGESPSWLPPSLTSGVDESDPPNAGGCTGSELRLKTVKAADQRPRTPLQYSSVAGFQRSFQHVAGFPKGYSGSFFVSLLAQTWMNLFPESEYLQYWIRSRRLLLVEFAPVRLFVVSESLHLFYITSIAIDLLIVPSGF